MLREVFYGKTRFEGFARSLGIARDTLTDRLGLLVDAGMPGKRPNRSDPVRHDYLPTGGRDFFGVPAALGSWGDRWLAGDAGEPIAMRHDRCGQDTPAEVVCAHCSDPLHVAEVTLRPGPGYAAALLTHPDVQQGFSGKAASTT